MKKNYKNLLAFLKIESHFNKAVSSNIEDVISYLDDTENQNIHKIAASVGNMLEHLDNDLILFGLLPLFSKDRTTADIINTDEFISALKNRFIETKRPRERVMFNPVLRPSSMEMYIKDLEYDDLRVIETLIEAHFSTIDMIWLMTVFVPAAVNISEKVSRQINNTRGEFIFQYLKKEHPDDIKIIEKAYKEGKGLKWAVNAWEKLYPKETALSKEILTWPSTKKTVTLANNGLRYIPPELFEITGIESLNLSYNVLESISPMIMYLRNNIKRLVLRNNRFTEFPESIFLLSTLEELDIVFNEGIPSVDIDNFKRVTNLTNLQVLKATLDSDVLPKEVENLTKLRVLELSSSTFNDVLVPMENMKNLERINFSGCKNLTSIPKGLFEIKTLRFLDISGSAIKQINIPQHPLQIDI